MLMRMEKVHTHLSYWLAVVFKGQHWLNLFCSWFHSFTDDRRYQLKFTHFCRVQLQKFVTLKEGWQYQATTGASFLSFSFQHCLEVSLEAKSARSEALSDGLTAGKVLGVCSCYSIHTANLPADHQQRRVRDVLPEVAMESGEESYHEPGESWSRCQKWRPRTHNAQGDQQVWRQVHPWQ